MGLANIFELPTNDLDWIRWSFNNNDLHNQITFQIARTKGVVVTAFLIDPIPPEDLANWAYRHQQIHNAQNQILGIQGNDLTYFNPRDPEEIRGWIALHANEMYQACTMLGIG